MIADPIGHTPVLPQEVLSSLSPSRGDTVVDATVGGGGHARLMAERIGAEGTLIGLDVDPSSLSAAEESLRGASCRVVLIRHNFGWLGEAMDAAGVASADVVFADLGVRSAQLDDPMRGFSFRSDGPLDMRLDDRLSGTAADLVNGLREQALADLIYFNADERHSRRIAKRICETRREHRIVTTGMLSAVVCGALGADPASRKQKIHPATRVFQALRIAVNDELGALDRLLASAPERLKPGGRIGVLSFHSLEDGRVKRDFRERHAGGLYEILTKRPVVADEGERSANPRSRSAKFRAAVRRG